jgi:hypothetical protein
MKLEIKQRKKNEKKLSHEKYGQHQLYDKVAIQQEK